jgi:hypothetical protein
VSLKPPIDVCNETSAYGHIHARRLRARRKTMCPLASANGPQAFALRLPSRSTSPSSAPRKHDPDGTPGPRASCDADSRKPTESKLSTDLTPCYPRTGRPGVKDPQPLRLFADAPPPKPAEHPFVASTLPQESGESPAAPRAVRRARFPGRRGAAFGNTRRPSPAFQGRPAKGDVFLRFSGAFHRLSAASVESCLSHVRDSISPSRRPVWGIASGRSAPFRLLPSASP